MGVCWLGGRRLAHAAVLQARDAVEHCRGPLTPVNNFVTIRLLPDNKPGDTLLFSGGGYVAKVTPSIVG